MSSCFPYAFTSTLAEGSPHRPSTDTVLHRLRAQPPFDVRGVPPEIFEDRVFTSLDEVEWEVFRLRRKQLTGEELK